MKKFLKFSLLLAAVLSMLAFAGCGSDGEKKAVKNDAPLKVGVTPGPHAEVMDEVKKIAEKKGLKMQVIEFSDYVTPNSALADGEIDVNSFQHQPYLDNVVKERGYKLVSVAKTMIFPIGIYSKKIKDIKAVGDNAVITLPNDPTNCGRALVLLENVGLIKLKAGLGIKATPMDIVENKKNLKIIESEAAQIPRTLDDVTIAAINCNYAMSAGLVPAKDALAREDSNSPYANILVTRENMKDDPRVKKLIEAYHSPEIKKFVNEHFGGSAFPTW